MDESMSNVQRFRTSCDRCQAAKVKCSRAKPSCWRCSQSGQQCVYSPLRRTGRPKTSSASYTSVQNNREKASRQQKKQKDSGWHQRQQQQQQDNGDYSFLAASTEGASPGEMNTALAPSELWQSESMVLLTDLPRSVDVAQTRPNDLMPNFETCGFDIQDITPNFEVFDPNLTLGGSASPRTFSISDNTVQSSIASFSSWSSGLWNCPTTNNASTGCPAPPPISIPFSEEISVSQSDFRSKTNAATGPDISLTLSSSQTSERPSLLSQLSDQPPAVPSPVCQSLFARAQLTSIEPTASSESAMTGLAQTSSHPDGPRYSSECYKALSEILARLNEDSSEGEGVSLDKLLGLDRELHRTIKRVLACGRCLEKSSNQTMIMLMFMALDTLLCLFEKQQDAAVMQTKVSKLPSRRAMATTTTRGASHFPWMDKALLVGSFAVDDKLKTVFLRQLVLAFVDNLGSVLSELERQADRVLKGVNCRIAKEIAVDICKRALFLRGWLRLAS